MSGTALSIGQFAEFSAAVLKALPREISSSDALAWARNGKKLESALQSALCPLATPAVPVPVVGNGVEQFEAKIFHFDRNISSEKAVEAIKAADWESGKIEHLLSFGAKFPEEQRKYTIIALGSVAEVRGRRDVPYLSRDGAGRGLGLHWWGYDWLGRYRFLAVRKLPSAA